MKYILLLLVLTGCYNSRKANQQFFRAVAFDPSIPAGYCARTYPPRDTTIHDTTTITDTAYYPPEFVTDTVRELDTVRITTVITKPGQIVTRTVTIRDTIKVTSTAALDAANLQIAKLQSQKDGYVAEVLKSHKARDKWRTIALVSLGVNAFLAFFKIRSMLTPKLRSV